MFHHLDLQFNWRKVHISFEVLGIEPPFDYIRLVRLVRLVVVVAQLEGGIETPGAQSYVTNIVDVRSTYRARRRCVDYLSVTSDLKLPVHLRVGHTYMHILRSIDIDIK